jgi:hypothetical protein
MMSHARTSMKFFTYGLLFGLAFSPYSGKENRSRVMTWFAASVRDVVKI